jgi:hypothetical protein
LAPFDPGVERRVRVAEEEAGNGVHCGVQPHDLKLQETGADRESCLRVRGPGVRLLGQGKAQLLRPKCREGGNVRGGVHPEGLLVPAALGGLEAQAEFDAEENVPRGPEGVRVDRDDQAAHG